MGRDSAGNGKKKKKKCKTFFKCAQNSLKSTEHGEDKAVVVAAFGDTGSNPTLVFLINTFVGCCSSRMLV